MTLLGLKVSFENIVLAIFALTLLVQLFYFLYFFIRLTFFKNKEDEMSYPPVTVIIAARNEESNLVLNLPKIFEQDYPKFQVVVVNDRSWDETGDVLRAFQSRHSNLHVVNIQDSENYTHGKKLAVTLGIKGAEHENLLFTDADCCPASNQWIKKMAMSFQKKSLILGYSPYEKQKGILNKLIRFDAVNIGVQYLSFALAGIPYMGVGRNMSYRKDLFFSVGGFKSHYHVASGDDDLFVNEVGKNSEVNVMFEPESQMVSKPEESFSKWLTQKRRHFTTAKHYKGSHKIFLSLYPSSLLMFVMTLIILLFTQLWLVALIGFGFRVLIQLLILNKPMKILGGSDLIFLTPLIELVFLILNPIIYFSNFIVKPTRWS
jgi:cellulose synthase/poly-beta-1,6-N-acetylglucosamine synthase-like glycosyltransferase